MYVVEKEVPCHLAILHMFLKFFKKTFIYLFLEREEGREKEREASDVWLLLFVSHCGPGPQPRRVP